MANLSHYGSDALAEVHNHGNVNNNMINQAVQVMPSSEQSNVVNHLETEITSDSNIIPYSQYVIESQQAAVQKTTSPAQQDALILSVKVLNEGQNVALTCNDNVSDSCAQSVEIDRLKQTLSEHLKEKESLMQTVSLLKNDFKKEESRNIDREIALEKRIKQLDNIKAQQLEPKLYVGDIIVKTNPIVIPDSEETLMLAEESRSKMLLKQKDPMMLEKKVNTTPVDYAALNQLYKDFETRFVPQTELSAEQAFWSQNSVNSPEPILSSRPTIVEVPKELPKVSMVNTSLKKLKHHLAGFDVVVKERTTPTAITEGSWGFEHTKACFRDEIIPFVKALKDLFNTFNQYLVDELSEVQNVFHQMEQAVEQHRLESKTFEVKMNQVLNENERLLEQVLSKDIVNIIVNSSVNIASVNVHECEKCLQLETELQTDFVEKEIYDKLFKSFTTLEKHCISLEVDTQLNQEIFQRDNSVSNQSAPSFDQLFELNELKAQSQEKDTIIKKLKERIKALSGKMNEDKIKQELEEIETINIELDHRVTKLIAENEHLKQTYKQLYDSIKPTRIRSKEQCDDLINQVNIKSVEISDLNARLQEKVLVITALKNDLRKLKGKDLADNAVTKHTIDLEMLKIDVEYLNPRLLNNRPALASKLVAVTPKNKDKRVRFTEPVTSSENANTKTSSSSNLVSNKNMLSSTRVKPSTSASGSKPLDNAKKDKIQQTPSSTQKNKVEAHPRKVKSSLKNKDYVVEPKGTTHVQHSKLNMNSELKCVKCNGCMLSYNRDLCVFDFINNVHARTESKFVKKNSKRKVWKPTGKVFTNIGYIWRPTGRTFTIVGNACPLTRITTTTEVPLRKPTALDNETSKTVVTLVYSQKPRKSKTNVPVSKSKVLKFVSANKKEPNQSWGSIVSDVPSSSLDECMSSKLFSGVDLLTGSRGNNLYNMSLGDMMASSPICLLSKASKTKSWLWHRHLSHLNFGAINHLARHGLVRGLPKLKFEKDHLCSACAMGKSKDRLGPDTSHEIKLLATSVKRLVPNPPPSTPFVPPSRTDWDILFQPLFDELLTPPPSVDHPAPEVIALIAEVVAPEPAASTGSPSSTTVDQDAPSPSNSQTTPETQSPIIPNDVEEDNHDLDVAHMNNDPFFGIPILENNSEASSSSDVIPTVVQTVAPNSEHVTKWLCKMEGVTDWYQSHGYREQDKLSLHRIKKMEKGRINGNELKTELKRIRTQIIKPQKKKLGQKDKIAFAHLQKLLFLTIIGNPSSSPKDQGSKCAEKDRVTFATGTLTNDALSWWNSYAQPIGIDQANQIAWTELKRLLTDKYCPRTKVKKMEDEFYNLTVKGNDLKTYVRRFQELTILCPNMVPNTEKLMEAFIGGLPRSIEGNVTASKPQTLEEAINIAQRLMDQIIKRNSMLETNDRKRKLEDERNIINNNNYQNNYNNNTYN
ncbi:retrovirus-related pol polyprotein from transposon TNT 1-94 [Tanacetum coccineum]